MATLTLQQEHSDESCQEEIDCQFVLLVPCECRILDNPEDLICFRLLIVHSKVQALMLLRKMLVQVLEPAMRLSKYHNQTENDTCGDENPFFLQGAHTPLFTKMKIEVSGGECGNGTKTVEFGLKTRPGAQDYLPELLDDNRREAVTVNVGKHNAISVNDMGCDELLDNKADSCVQTSKSTDHNTCKEHGYDMVVPRSIEHWKHLVSKYDGSYFQTIPGIYKPTDGGDFRHVAMNSEAMPPGGTVRLMEEIGGFETIHSANKTGTTRQIAG